MAHHNTELTRHFSRTRFSAAICALAVVTLVTGTGPVAFAADPDPVRPVDSGASAPITPILQTDIFIGESVMPSGFVASADGSTGYVTALVEGKFYFLDLASRTVSGSVAIPAECSEEITISADGSTATSF